MARQPFDCFSCDKFHPKNPENLKKGGSCRARPPQPFVVMVGVERGPLGAAQPILQTTTAYPGVGEGDYCHEHPMLKNASRFDLGALADLRKGIVSDQEGKA